MPSDLPTVIAEIQHQTAVAVHAINKVMDLTKALTGTPGAAIPTLAQTGTQAPTSIFRWVEWLKENGPAVRQEVADGTGTQLTKRALGFVNLWNPMCETQPEGTYGDDALFRVDEQRAASGRPRAIYFLWGQRYDVQPRFGVGPVRGAQNPSSDPESGPETLLGVIQPPPADVWDNDNESDTDTE